MSLIKDQITLKLDVNKSSRGWNVYLILERNLEMWKRRIITKWDRWITITVNQGSRDSNVKEITYIRNVI